MTEDRLQDRRPAGVALAEGMLDLSQADELAPPRRRGTCPSPLLAQRTPTRHGAPMTPLQPVGPDAVGSSWEIPHPRDRLLHRLGPSGSHPLGVGPVMALVLEPLAFCCRQPAHSDGVYLLRPFKSHLQSNRPTITEHEPSYKSGSLSVGTGLKTNLCVSVPDLIRLAGRNLPKEHGHTVPLLARNPNGRSRVALDDDRHLGDEIPAVAGAVCGPEVTSGTVKARIAHHRGPLTPSSVRVAKGRGAASRDTHSRRLGHLVGIWRTAALLVRSAVACRCDKRPGQQNRHRSSGHSHASQSLLHLLASSGSAIRHRGQLRSRLKVRPRRQRRPPSRAPARSVIRVSFPCRVAAR